MLAGASADEAAGARVALHVHVETITGCAERRGVHHLAVADVHAHVAHRAVEEDQVTGLQVARDTGVPIVDWAALECGSATPAAA